MVRIIMIFYISGIFFCISDVQGQNLCQDVVHDRYFSSGSSVSTELGFKRQDSIVTFSNTRSSGNYLQATSITYDFLSESDSILQSKKVEVFDTKGNVLQSISYTWIKKDNDWRPNWKQIRSYDDQSRLINGNYYDWDIETKNWVPERKSEQTYSDTLSIYTCKVWDKESSEWINECGNEYYYDELGNLIFIRQKSWETSINAWIIYSYWEINYDEFGNDVSIRWYDTLAENYTLFSKTETTGEGTNLKIDETFHWDQISESWELYEVYERHYDEFGNQVSDIRYSLDTLVNEFFISKTGEYEYDENANFTQITSINWDETGATTYGWKENTYYSNSGEIEYKVRYNLDDTGSEWLLDYKKYYYWSDVITEADEAADNNILVFPNPTFSTIYFLGISDVSAIRLHSISGGVIFEGQIPDNRLDLSELKPGMYILSFYDQNKMHFVKRIVKQ